MGVKFDALVGLPTVGVRAISDSLLMSKTLFLLVRITVPVNRHHNHGNSYKGKDFTEAGLQFLKFSPLLSW